MDLENMWVVEFSATQNSAHVDTANDTIIRNSRNVRKGISTDYVIVGFFNNPDSTHI